MPRLDDERGDDDRGEDGELPAAVHSVPIGIVASAAAAATSRERLTPMPSVVRKPTVQAANSATPTPSSDADPARERLVRVADRFLQPGRNRDDTEQQPVVPVPERRSARDVHAAPRRAVSIACSTRVLVAEVQPPERGASASASRATTASRRSSGTPTAPAPTTTIDSPSATMITSPCRSQKCSAAITNPSVLVNQGVNQSSSAAPAQRMSCGPPPSAPPTRTIAAAVRLNGTIRRIAATSRDGRALRVHPRVEDDDDARSRARTRGPSTSYALGIGERDHEKRPHPAEEEEPEAQQVGRDRVRQPRVAVVHPPDHREHHDDLQRARRVAALRRGRRSAA